MNPSVGVVQTGPGTPPHVVLANGDDTLTFPWPVWEMLVHRASHLYVAWALTHGGDWLQLERATTSIDDGAVLDARARVLGG